MFVSSTGVLPPVAGLKARDLIVIESPAIDEVGELAREAAVESESLDFVFLSLIVGVSPAIMYGSGILASDCC